MGDREFRAELLAEWTGVVEAVFDPDDVEALFGGMADAQTVGAP